DADGTLVLLRLHQAQVWLRAGQQQQTAGTVSAGAVFHRRATQQRPGQGQRELPLAEALRAFEQPGMRQTVVARPRQQIAQQRSPPAPACGSTRGRPRRSRTAVSKSWPTASMERLASMSTWLFGERSANRRKPSRTR